MHKTSKNTHSQFKPFMVGGVKYRKTGRVMGLHSHLCHINTQETIPLQEQQRFSQEKQYGRHQWQDESHCCGQDQQTDWFTSQNYR
jgi:hypothetical protein